MKTDVQVSRRIRLGILSAIVLLAGFGIFSRLVWIQVFESRNLRIIAENQYHSKLTIQPYRGTIYDRVGRPLTDNSGEYVSLGINPHNVHDIKRLAKEFARETGINFDTIINRLNRNSKFVELGKRIPVSKAERLKLSGWNLIANPVNCRTYPHSRTFGQLVGFTDVDNNGISGLELTYNNILSGRSGYHVIQKDVSGGKLYDSTLPNNPHEDGGDVILTVDLDIQSVLEKELISCLEFNSAEKAAGIVLNPRTGEVAAMVSLPGFDPNSPNEFPVQRQKNIAVTDLYEPGSTFKLIPTALLLEENKYFPQSIVDCGDGEISIYGKTIHDQQAYGKIPLVDVVSKSSNVGMIRLTEEMKRSELYKIISDFGFLTPTGIELTGEASGSLPKPRKWSGLTKPNLVIGQGIAVTMMQMAMAYAVIANDGVLVKPTLIRELRHSNGKRDRVEPLEVRRVLSGSTAEYLRDMLIDAVDNGTGKRAKIEGIKIAGKTGTAQMVNFDEGGYYDDRFVASFIGYFPAERPKYLMLIAVFNPHGPKDEHTGGSVAAPVFKRVAEKIISIKPFIRTVSINENVSQKELVVLPDLNFMPFNDVKTELKNLGLRYKRYGSGELVYDQSPSPGSKIEVGDVIQITLGPGKEIVGPTLIMPVLTGLSMRDAINKASINGLSVASYGSGKVSNQSPNSGTRVQVGSKCVIEAQG